VTGRSLICLTGARVSPRAPRQERGDRHRPPPADHPARDDQLDIRLTASPRGRALRDPQVILDDSRTFIYHDVRQLALRWVDQPGWDRFSAALGPEHRSGLHPRRARRPRPVKAAVKGIMDQAPGRRQGIYANRPSPRRDRPVAGSQHPRGQRSRPAPPPYRPDLGQRGQRQQDHDPDHLWHGDRVTSRELDVHDRRRTVQTHGTILAGPHSIDTGSPSSAIGASAERVTTTPSPTPTSTPSGPRSGWPGTGQRLQDGQLGGPRLCVEVPNG
jgi:hypothetical protein